MKKLAIGIGVVCALLFSACDAGNPSATVPSETWADISTMAPTQLPAPTLEPTVPPTEPDLSLNIPAGTHAQIFTSEETGDYLEYYLHVPDHAVQNMPLIIFLHGDGEVGSFEGLKDYGVIPFARQIYGEEFPFICLTPATRTTSWTSGTIPETLKGLIDAVVESCQIDRNKIIITGHSRGSMGTWNMISLYGDYFSAAVPISCGNELPLIFENCIQVPVLGFAGTVGEYEIRYQNRMRVITGQIVYAGGKAELTVVEGCDHSSILAGAYTEETFEWMLSQ